MIKLSVIVPTLNDSLIRNVVERIQVELESLGPNQYKSEIIVVGKDDASRLANLSDIRFLDTGNPVGASEARNRGIHASTGGWLLFVDSDCLVQPGWATAMTERLAAGESVVGGGVTFPTEGYWPLVYNLSLFHEYLTSRERREMRYLPTLNLAVKRSVVDDVGLMDEMMKRGHDMDWTIRMAQAGYRLVFEPKAVVSHHPARTEFRTVWRDGIRGGYYNRLNRQKYDDYYQTPGILSRPWLVRLLSPLIALAVTGRIFLRTPGMLRFIPTAPGIYLTKVAWCVGASLQNEPGRI
ncbi:MAG: glycosyltransferase [Chloroflexota bacterium]